MSSRAGGATSDAGRGEVLWTPPPEVWTTTAAGRFASAHGFDDYAALHRWSVTDLEGFWDAVARDLGVRWHDRPLRVLAGGEAAMPGAHWFPGATLNYAEHALAAAADRPDDVAVLARSQTRADIEMTWSELAAAVAACADGLRELGVERGDVVAAYAPNIPETLVAFLATASIGAIWSSCAPEFGARSVIDRLGQLDPKVLIAVDGYRYGARPIDRGDEVATVRGALEGLRHVIAVPYLGDGLSDSIAWPDLATPDARDAAGPMAFAPVLADHPLYVLFSSGTTGLPKAIVHGHGGITLEHLKVLTLHQDLGPDDRFSWFTTTGWMMWNYLVSGLLTGSGVVLFDGDPGYPDLNSLWEWAGDSGTTVFGASAPFIMACRKAGIDPDRGALRWVGSTGAPLPAAGFRWVSDVVGVPVSSISGGTDVCTAFVGSSPLVPVRAGEISCALLGCAVDAVDADGVPVPPGVTGELVITAPMPSMPVRFWADSDGSRYRAAYFEEFPGRWRHGDWITFTDDGACTISGRSDATLNRGGVRLGTSDFYAVVEELPEVADTLVVYLDQPLPGDTDADTGGDADANAEANADANGGDDSDDNSYDDSYPAMGELVLFVVLTPDVELTDELRARINAALRSELSPRHVPDRIEAVPAVPRTLSGKKLEVPVKRLLQGVAPDEVASRESLADPTALDWFTGLISG